MKLVNDHHAVKAQLMPSNHNGYLLLAAEVGSWCGPFPAASRARSALLARLKTGVAQLAARHDVEEAIVFRAIFRPPGEGNELLHARGRRPARYDVVVVIRAADVDATGEVRTGTDYALLGCAVRGAARRTHEIAAYNPAGLGEVDYRPNHPFLFNYFFADDTDTLLQVWEYTAGWFQTKTGLDNSTLLQPLAGEPDDYGIINHASWPRVWSFLPSLVFRPSFRRFVLANFKANDVAAQPIIYRRA